MEPPNLLLLLLLTFVSIINAQFPAPYCGLTGNFANSTYQTTLTTVLSSMSITNSLSLTYGFFNASTPISGASQNLFVIGYCCGDLTAESCHACLNASASDICSLCPLQKEAVLYSENCTVGYSNTSIFFTVTTYPNYQLFNGNNVTSPDTYNTTLEPLLKDLWGKAAADGSLRKYAAGNASADFATIYAMVQYTSDLTEQQCSDCLVTVVARLDQCCAGKMGVNSMAASCQFQYGTNVRFFDPVGEPLLPPPAPLPQVADAPPPPPSGKSNSTKTVIIAVAASVSVVLFIGVAILLLVKRKKKQPRQRVEGEVEDEISTAESLQFDFRTIRAATDNFSNSKKLGQGSFGVVYVGRLSNGQETTVKWLSQNSGQGEVEFKNEVILLARLQHRNLVRLLGFCLEGVKRLLIDEFEPNSSLDQFIFDPLKRVNLDWDRRHKIIMGVARGLRYLHEDSRLRIIHWDLKASNILLDLDMNPKISDFAMARLFELDQTQAETNRIVGTYRYMAPEHAMHGNFFVKSDVFSFEVSILEIVNGQKNNLFRVGDNTKVLTSYSWREGTISNIINPSIKQNMDPPNLLLLLLLLFASTINAQFPATYCGSTGNFIANSTYQTTLTTLLSSISTTNSFSLSYGFFNASGAVSGTSQTLYVFGLCRGDFTAMGCRACLNDLASDMSLLCPLQKEALLYTGDCIIRYSNTSFFGAVATEPTYVVTVPDNVTSPDMYDTAMRKLLDGLMAKAAGGGSLRKYASGNESAGPDMIYALVQCTPDLTEQQCSNCLVIGIQTIRECCVRYKGGRFMVPNCLILYGTNNRFFNPVNEPLPPPPTSPPSQEGYEQPPPPVGKSNSTRTVIIAAVTSVSALLVIGVVVVLLKMKRKMKQPRQSVEGEVVHDISTAESLQFDFGTVRAATDDFSDSNRLGQGGFGAVYKGQLSNGREIAVKRLSQNSSQGQLEFKNEVKLLARLQHRNLIRLLGFCLEGIERLLIYEFVPNSSLDQFIFDPLQRANLNWDRRHKIIMGVARGMLYLHEDSQLRIIHRDLKASNILLDLDMNPKISDFGMARLFELDQTHATTNRIVGTYGYMAPEYVMNGNFSVKSDVFSFGVLVLEIVSGQRNNHRMGNDMEVLTSYVWKHWMEGLILNIIDPSIASSLSTEISRCIHIGLLCVQENVASRPTMASVLLMLNSHCVSLQVPSRPAFFLHSSTKFGMPSTQDYNSRVSKVKRSRSKSNQFSINEASMTEPYPR